MLSASASNHQHLFSFNGRNGNSQPTTEPSGSFDFLPSVSFDDLQTSLESASTEFKLAQFPSPTGQGSILDSQSRGAAAASSMADNPTSDRQSGPATTSTASSTTNTSTRAGIPPPVSRPTRSGSILRRPSTSSRQPSISSTVSGFSAAGDNASTGPPTTRTRRQSHYPPVSSTNNMSKPPRKSIGPGVIDGDYTIRTGQKRRPSLISNNGAGTESTRTSLDGNVGLGLGTTRNHAGMTTMTNSRAAKARSVGQPLPRTSSTNLTASNMLTPDHNRFSTAVSPRSPRVAGRGSGAPGSAQSVANQKRATIMPGMPILPHPPVATGLGARTISPTDTRRMKRMSMHQAQTTDRLANAPPPPPPDYREHSRSPSMIPRKTSATPSSSRTTPDANRKSHQSSTSVGSSLLAANSVRTSTGPAQPRLSTSASTSRLPTPKTLPPLAHHSMVADDHDDVPPVPAIPKAYESPRDSLADASFQDKRKTTLTADAISIHSNSTGSFSIPSGTEASGKVRRKASTRKSTTAAVPETEKKSALTQAKRHPAGLRLPPITVGPLNPSTAARVAALQEQRQSERNLSPPASRIISKTPSTPMTASRSTFFSRNFHDGHTEPLHFRSSSTLHHSRLDSASGAGGTSSSESIVGCGPEVPSGKPSISPFLSSSLPRNGPDSEFIRRPKTGDIGNVTESLLNTRPQQKPSGPRAPRPARSGTKSPPPASDPEEPPTPSSISSLRRKLSLSWKRGTSKNGTTANPSGAADRAELAKQESMPPPRIPTSATAGNLDSIQAPSSHTSNKSSGTYLESRRRKSSAPGLQTHGHDRTKSENLGQNGSLRREPRNGPAAADHHAVASRNPSVMNRIIRPKASTASIRQQEPWTAELDKDDLIAEEEMRKMGSRRKETEIAAKSLDSLRKRATPKERVSAAEAVRIAMLNVYERGEIMDYDDVYFCGTQNARKVAGDLQSDKPNHGYDDDRGDYTIVPGDHLAYRYEIIDVLGKGSFGQVVRCIDHKLGVLVAVKIIRNKKRFHQQALVEVNILQKIREWVSEREGKKLEGGGERAVR